MNQIKLSVITPVYNGERFLAGCIENVIGQKCSLAEHLIVDGASSDKSVEIIKRYAKKYPQIRWISEKDNGESEAMNKGIKMARGEIISFLNYDDFYQPNVLKRILEIFKALSEPSLLVGNCNIRDDQGKVIRINKPKQLGVTDLLSQKEPFPLNPSAYFYHKSLHERMGLYELSKPYGQCMMDLDFIIKAVQVAKVKYIDEIWGNQRLIKGTITLRLKEQGLHDLYHKQLLVKHRKRLPLSQQWLVIAKFIIFRKLRYRRIQYYFKQPSGLPGLIRRKLTNQKIKLRNWCKRR